MSLPPIKYKRIGLTAHNYDNTSFVTHCTMCWGAGEKGVPWMNSIHRVLNRFAYDNLALGQSAFVNRIYNHLYNQLRPHDSTFSLWVSSRDERFVTITLTVHNVAKLKFRMLVPSLSTPMETKTRARYDIGCLIGDVSQGFFECSYNDDDVYRAWQSKTLNEYWDKYLSPSLKDSLTNTSSLRNLFKVYLPDEVYNWEKLFDVLYALAEGWPTCWLSEYVTHGDLALLPAYTR